MPRVDSVSTHGNLMRNPLKQTTPLQSDLTQGSIAPLVRQLAVPASTGFFFSTMYNVVDTWFAGMISTDAVAALSLSFSPFFLIVSMGGGLSAGGTALMGTALGAKDERKASLFAMQGLVFGLLASLLITLLGLLVSPALFRFLGAEEGYLATCMEYMNTIFGGAIFFLLVHMFNSVLNARGDTRSFRNFLIIGFILNCVLDPWFVFGGMGLPAMGVRGIALATVLVQCIGSIYMGRRAWKTGLLRLHSWRDLVPRFTPFRDIARQGLPSSMNYFTIGLGIFVITYYVSQFGKAPVAAYGIGTRVIQIALMPAIGLNIAALALAAQNAGALRFERVHAALATCLRYGAWITAGGMVFVLLLAGQLMGFFSDDPAVVEAGAVYLRIDGLALYGYVALMVCVSTLQGLKRPMFGVWIGIFRQFVAPVAVFQLLIFLGSGLTGIWWGICSIVWSTAVFAFFYTRWKLARIEQAKLAAEPGGNA